jgi:hypothetical protein
MTLKIELPGKRTPLPPRVRRSLVTPREVDDDMAVADDDTFGTHVNSAVRCDTGIVLRIYLPSKRDTIH